jgi:hypothetical protein
MCFQPPFWSFTAPPSRATLVSDGFAHLHGQSLMAIAGAIG